MRETIQSLGHDLARQPLALALVVINCIFLGAGLYVMRDIGNAVERKDALLLQIITDRCQIREK